MKWNNRLKSVLTNPEKTDFPGDCLETELRITAESQKSGVSAVIRSSQSRDSFRNNNKLAEIKTDHFHSILNRFIEAGVKFEVSTDDFHFIDEWQTLKLSDREFIKLNSAAVLSHLQQSLLMKHLFNHSPEQFEDFAFEIKEREAIYSEDCLNSPLRITAKSPYEIYCKTVEDVTKKWFADLLEKKT